MSEIPKLTRRRAIEIAGATGAAAVLTSVTGRGRLLDAIGLDDAAQAATTSCVLTPAKTEGPYFVDEKLNRSDIRTDPTDGSVEDGVALALTMVVVRADGECAPVPGAVVDIWHANAGGLYSDESANGTSGQKFLRGYQVKGEDGAARFTTIYPGWYSGRAIHIHYKIRLYDGSSETYEFTSQLFFDPAVTAAVVQSSAYSSRGTPDTSNASDNIYGSDGDKLLVPLTSDGNGGYAGTFVVGLTGLPETTTTTTTGSDTTGSTDTGSTGANTVRASLAGAHFDRNAAGRRVLRLKVSLQERAKVTARVTRAGQTLAAETTGRLRRGTRFVELALRDKPPGGRARLTVTFKDAAGASKSVHKRITIPKRRS
jgi:protocatechuate 3,4-dioxygenase beta subunit